jgi:hypothetical protein
VSRVCSVIPLPSFLVKPVRFHRHVAPLRCAVVNRVGFRRVGAQVGRGPLAEPCADLREGVEMIEQLTVALAIDD